MTKSPGLVLRMKHKISKQLFFGIFIYAYHTMLIIQFHSMENAYHNNSWYGKSAYQAMFVVFFFLKLYDKYCFYNMKWYDKHFCQPGMLSSVH